VLEQSSSRNGAFGLRSRLRRPRERPSSAGGRYPRFRGPPEASIEATGNNPRVGEGLSAAGLFVV
jgi:hypothetical protein